MSTYTQDITHLISKINTNVPDNDTQAITAARIRDAMGAVAYNYDLYVLKTDLDTAGYVTASQLEGLVTDQELQEGMQSVLDDSYAYVVEKINEIPGVDLSAYVDYDSLQSYLGSYVTKTELSEAGYLTAVPSEYVTDTELSSMGYVSQTQLSANSYVTTTSLQSALEPYVSQTQLSSMTYVTESQLSQELSSYATLSYLHTYYATVDLLGGGIDMIEAQLIAANVLVTDPETGDWTTDSMASQTYVADYVSTYAPMPDLSAYVTKSQLSQELGSYVTKTELSAAGYLTAVPSEYITETELSGMGYITSSELGDYVTETELSAMSYVTESQLQQAGYATTTQLSTKQDTLVSGTNIKTINNESLLGSGNIDIQAGGSSPDYSHVLTFTAEQANSTIKFKREGTSTSLTDAVLEYSTDDGATWNEYTLDTTITLAAIGDTVKFKGTNGAFSNDNYSNNYHRFVMTGKIAASGSIMSLTNNLSNSYVVKANYMFFRLFYECTALTKAPELPATTLTSSCYHSMFYGCTSLTKAPELPAMTLAVQCYKNMFYVCTSLTKAPELPAMTLTNNCYESMFYGCTSLTKAPELPATTLANGCYNSMFANCSSLIEAPELPATTLASSCYLSMFYGCTSLTKAPELPATTLLYGVYQGMFSGCSKIKYVKAMFTDEPTPGQANNWLNNTYTTGIFIKSTDATWTTVGSYGVPTGWTVYKTVAIDTDDVPESYVEDEGKTLQVVSGVWTKVTGGGGDMSAYVTKTELSSMGYITSSDLPDMSTYATISYVETYYATTTQLSTKQDTLVSGTNIKTINNESLLGSGNLTIESGSNIAKVTQAEYDAMEQAGTLDPDTLYIITDAQSADLEDYATLTYIETYYATQSYVADYVAAYVPTPDLSAYVDYDSLQSYLGSYVTKTELSSMGYLTAVPSEYVTETELSNMGFITSSSIPSVTVTNSGSGNAVTSVTASGHALTVTKGSTFLTSANLIYDSTTNTLTINV